MSDLYVRNRQRTRKIDIQLIQRVATWLLEQTWPGEFQLGILLVGDPEMTRLNEGFLSHAGSTDVLSFNYSSDGSKVLEGEVFVCVDEALRQAVRFRTDWRNEIFRYIVHGLLHLQGYDDSAPLTRKRMKREENRLVNALAGQFALGQLSATGLSRQRVRRTARHPQKG